MNREPAKTVKKEVFETVIEKLSDRDLYTLKLLLDEESKKRGTQYKK